jgi:predicted acyltransferase
MEENKSNRLQSIDALRGFDMLWIMGCESIVVSLSVLAGGSVLEWLARQMEHVPWNGFHFMDLIFPLFLFISGVSFPFSLAKRRANNNTNRDIHKHIFTRALLLVIFGFIYSNGGLKFDFATLRFASVLARIGLAWMFGALIYMHTGKNSVRFIWITAILLFSSLLTSLVPAPDAPAGASIFSPEGNIGPWFDRQFLPGIFYGGNFDPEGFLGIISAIATALAGMMAGTLLAHKGGISADKKAAILLFSGLLLIAASQLFNLIIPINKALWSPSFVFITAGISLSLLSVFYWIIDVKGYRKWTFPLRVIGMNSITIYMAQAIISFSAVSAFFIGGFASLFSKEVAELINACGYVTVCWLFLWFLYKKGIFLKI